MRAPSSDSRFLNDRITSWTRLSFSAKHTGKVDIAPSLALSIHIVAIGASTFFDTKIHNVLDLME